LKLRELPQSVRVMTRQALDDLGATKLDDVLDYVGGVSRQNNFGGLWDNVAIRGLAGNENTGMATLFNGFASNRGFNAPRDLAGVERIEFLKGPAATLYGASEPGGTLNVVSKAPLWQSAQSLEAYVGSFDLKRLALDSTGALAPQLAYRLNAAVEQRDSFRDHIRARREVLAPALTWKLGADTVLDYRGEALRHRTPLDRGVVADAQGRLDVVPRERFLGEPADGDVTVTNQTHQFVLSHDWNDHWRSRAAVSYRGTSIQGFSTEATRLSDTDGRTLTRQRRERDYASHDVALQAELQGRLRLGGMAHEVLAGVESFRFRMDTVMRRVSPSPTAPYAIDVLNPVYGQAQPTPTANTDTLEHQRNTGFYLQDAVHLAPAWRLLLGLRSDNYRQELLNRRDGRTTVQSPSTLVPRLGLSWLPDAQWTVYASASESFRPNVSSGGRSFEPEQGRALELGSKWESTDRRLGATAALFHIVKRNVLTTDPAEADKQVAAGEVRSQGAEFDLAGQLSQHWRLNAALVLTDAEVTRDNTLAVGSRLLNVARVNGSVLAVYEASTAEGQRWSLGGGFTHVGKRLGQTGTSFELPAYTTAKLVASWRLSPTLRLSLDVDNVFDTTYYSSSYSRVWVTPGTARNLSLGLQVKL
ncbi:TonB-dependent siderophore receptor, partial [Pelomonas sp. HMWF004]